MLLIKTILCMLLFLASTGAGILISKKYANRVRELKEYKNLLNIVKTKIKFTYEPLGEIFIDISNSFSENISNVLKMASEKMKHENAQNAWKMAIENNNTNITKEDKEMLLMFGKMLGKTDIEGQVSQIEQTIEFVENQISKAESERMKNEKMYKTLGMTVGAGLVVLLI